MGDDAKYSGKLEIILGKAFGAFFDGLGFISNRAYRNWILQKRKARRMAEDLRHMIETIAKLPLVSETQGLPLDQRLLPDETFDTFIASARTLVARSNARSDPKGTFYNMTKRYFPPAT